MNLNNSLTILNSKEVKEIMTLLIEQFGVEEKLDFVFLRNTKDKIYILNRDVDRITFEYLRIDSAGLYLGTIQKDGFRLSIEGSQIISKLAKKNVVELSLEQKHDWLKGYDIDLDNDGNRFVILKWKNDILGCGKVKDGKLLNAVPKSRRLAVVNENIQE